MQRENISEKFLRKFLHCARIALKFALDLFLTLSPMPGKVCGRVADDVFDQLVEAAHSETPDDAIDTVLEQSGMTAHTVGILLNRVSTSGRELNGSQKAIILKLGTGN